MANFKNRIIGYGEEPIDQILFNPANWRIHPKSQQDALTGVLEEVGWVQNVIVNKQTGHLVDGHLRVQLADKAGEKTIPVTYVDLSESEEMTVLATIDPIAAMAATDKEKLDDVLRQVHADDARIQQAIADLAAKEGLYQTNEGKDTEPQIDKAEELRVKWGVESGQLWEMGEHRLICGDCTNSVVVDQVIQNGKSAITFTSPPYNAGVSSKLRGNTSINDNFYKNEYNDNKSINEYLELLKLSSLQSLKVSDYVFVNIQLLAGNKIAFINYLSYFVDKLADIAIWDKQHAAPQQAQRVMDSRFEFIVILSHSATRAIGTREFRGMVHNVYTGNPQRHNEYASSHAATFPIEFPQHFIQTFTNTGDVIYEPFSGSGTTIIACENLGRKCRAIEISPGYVAVALERWHQHTGKTPVLIA